MANGTIWMTSSKAWKGRIEWYSSTSVANNSSVVYAYVYTWKTDGLPTSGGGWFEGTLTVGNQAIDFSFEQCDPESIAYDVCVAELSAAIRHGGDGTGGCNISCSITKGYSTSLANVTCSGESIVTLDTIPQSASLSCSGSVLGEVATLSVHTESLGMLHTITYQCGSDSGTVCSRNPYFPLEWIPPLSLAAQAPSSGSVPVTLTLYSYDGYTQVSSHSVTVNFSVPSSVAPTVTVTVSDPTGYDIIYGGYIQGKSTVKAVLTASGAYGSTITAQQVSFEGSTYLGGSITTAAIKGVGNIILTATVKDSRGRTAQAEVTIPVLAYAAPAVTSITAERCNADGTENAKGSYLLVFFSASITALSSKNSASYVLRYKKSTDYAYTEIALTSLSGQYSVSGYSYIFEASKESSYNVAIAATDSFSAVTKSAIGPSEMTWLSHLANGLGMAIGKIAERVGYLDMGFHIYMNENRIHGLKDPIDDDEVATKGWVEELLRNAGISINAQSDDS